MSVNEDFAAPASTAGIQWEDLNGSLLLFTVNGVEEEINTSYGLAKQVARADMVVLDGDHAGETYDDSLIFPKVLSSQLRPRVGGKVLGRLGQGQKKPGQSPPWVLSAETTEADKKLARDWVARASTLDPPF